MNQESCFWMEACAWQGVGHGVGVSGHLLGGSLLATFRRMWGGAIPASAYRQGIGVDFKQPVIILHVSSERYQHAPYVWNGPTKSMQIQLSTRESPPREAASPIKYNGLRVRPAAVCAQPAVPYRDIIDWPAVLCCQRLQEASRVNLNSKNANSP